MLGLGLASAFAGDFARALSSEDQQLAGLAKLTPAELAHLEALVQRYKTGIAPAAPAVEIPAPPPAKKSAKLTPEWVAALLTLERTGKKPDKSDAMETRIAGDFDGWGGRSSFKLENGQVWTQVNNDSYVYTPAMKSPKVRIFPATFGTFWLEIEGVNQRCRVKPVRLE